MNTVWAIVIVVLAIVCVIVQSNVTLYHRNKSHLWRRKYEDLALNRNAEDALLFEWSCRDLMPLWEKVYPHVQNLPNTRKYSEWATFCANYPTRQQIEAHLELEGEKVA